ncbi:MAG: hypothetical protein D6744_00510 [Planctomycetota bacterium]|nr:MAG: hypothetical protein D6744_00510 [Planctomycetota bacterium]
MGKWHLTRPREAPTHPLDAGYDWYAGAMHNLGREIEKGGYTHWVKYVNGVPHVERNYATTDTADDAVARAAAMTPPWFLYVAFNAIHTPLHDPPQSLCAQVECQRFGCPTPAGSAERSRHMLETLDVVLEDMIERLRQIDPNVIVFLVGDNGTSPASAPPKPNRAKGTMYEGGVHVPLIVAGGGVRQGECDALVGTVDLLATISDLAGTPHTTADSVSFAPLLFDERASPPRRTLYAERFVPNFDWRRPVSLRAHARAIRNRRFKLIYRTGRYGSTFELYDLKLDPGETENLYPPLGGRPEKAFQKLFDELSRMGVVCEGDANDDGQVSLADLSIVITNLGVVNATRADGDADGDGDVDASDLAIVLSRLDLPC